MSNRVPLQDVRVLSLESRMRSEMARLLEKHGAVVTQAPSMQAVPLEDLGEATRFASVLEQGNCDVLVLMTGVGSNVLFDAMCTSHSEQGVKQLLAGIDIVCRGPKPAAVLKRWRLTPRLIAPEPNTSESLLSQMLEMDVSGRRVYVQEYGTPAKEVIDSLTKRGAVVERLSVYAWKLPDDIAPLTAAVHDLVAKKHDVLVVTSARQMVHLYEVATHEGVEEKLTEALQSEVVVSSIGPVASKELARRGIRPDVEPEHPKMGHLARQLARDWTALRRKQGSGAPSPDQF